MQAQIILKYHELLNPVLTALHALGGIRTKEEIYNLIIRQQRIIAPVITEKTSSKSKKKNKLYYNMEWAITYLKQFGLLSNPSRGRWTLTDKGRTTYHVDSMEVVENYRKFLSDRKKEESVEIQIYDKDVTEYHASQPRSPHFLTQLESTLRQRRIRRPEGSYTAELFAAGPARIAQKVGEEALEVIIAALHESRERQICEVADLLVHTLILLVELNIPLDEVLDELQHRHEARSS